MSASRPPWLWSFVTRTMRDSHDEASSAMVGYIIGTSVFIVGSVVLADFMAEPPGGVDTLASQEMRVKAESALRILVTTPGFPADWSDSPEQIDSVQRLGLLVGGSNVRIAPAKFAALAEGAVETTSGENGAVDYDEARAALGLEGYEFRITVRPSVRGATDGAYGTTALSSLKVGYVGSTTGGVSNDSASAEAGALDALNFQFSNLVRATVAGPGSFIDATDISVRNLLVPLLGTAITTSTIAPGTGTHQFTRAAPDVIDDALYLQSGLTNALAITANGALGYSPNREIRAVVGQVNMTGLAGGSFAWSEYVGTGVTRDDGDFGYIELSPDGGTTWYPISNTDLARSKDTPATPQTPGLWTGRNVAFTAVECAPCVNAPSVQVALHWTADGDANTGLGWIVDDLTLLGTSFSKTFEPPVFDVVVIGSHVDTSIFASTDIRAGMRDYITKTGGRLVILGGANDPTWLRDTLTLGARQGHPDGDPYDPAHPLLTFPNELNTGQYAPTSTGWDLTAHRDNKLFRTIITDDGLQLTASRPGVFGGNSSDGAIVLTSWQVHRAPSDAAKKFFSNVAAYGRYHRTYMEYGAAIPDGVPIAAASRSGFYDMDKQGSGDWADLSFTLQLWKGTRQLSPAPDVATALAPQNFTVTPSTGQIALGWDVPRDNGTFPITDYRIYRGTTNGSGTLLATVTVNDTAYTDASVTNGLTYYYNVTAVNAAGEGFSSVRRSAVTSTTASTPGSPTVVPGLYLNLLSWTSPASNGGSTIVGYNIYASTTSGAATYLDTVSLNATYTHQGLNAASKWYYQISALNARGESARSSEASGTTFGAPSLPGTLIATPGLNKISLTWTAATNATGYNIYRGNSSGALTLLTTIGTNTTYDDSTAPVGITRYYRVSGTNAVGEGSLSNEVNSKALGLPAAPAVTANPSTGVGAGRVQLHITEPVTLGGAPVLYYKVYYGDSPTNVLYTFTAGYNSTATNFHHVVGTPGVLRYYQVAAVTIAGEGPRSTQVASLSSAT